MKVNHRRKNPAPTEQNKSGFATKKMVKKTVSKSYGIHICYDGNRGLARQKKAVKRSLNSKARAEGEQILKNELDEYYE